MVKLIPIMSLWDQVDNEKPESQENILMTFINK